MFKQLLPYWLGAAFLAFLVLFLFTLTQGCSKSCCPPEDVYIIAVMENGQEIVVELPRGSINKDSMYSTREEALTATTPGHKTLKQEWKIEI